MYSQHLFQVHCSVYHKWYDMIYKVMKKSILSKKKVVRSCNTWFTAYCHELLMGLDSVDYILKMEINK